MKHIAIQGIKGSFHDIAAHQYFEGEKIDLACCSSFESLFSTVKKEKKMLGLMAIENTIAGSLLHNYELLRENNLTIIGEHKLHIEHSLVCLPDDEINEISEVNSHPVALAQCRHFLEKHPLFKIVEAQDTAGAAEKISRQRIHGHAAICHADAASIYGMKVLEHSIEDNKHNYTRFLILCHPDETEHVRKSAKINKSSIVFALPHEEGTLSRVLSILSFYNINLTKIQSLPIIGKEWQYLFYVDVTFNDYSLYRKSLEAIRPLTDKMRILGEYEGK